LDTYVVTFVHASLKSAYAETKKTIRGEWLSAVRILKVSKRTVKKLTRFSIRRGYY
jgi:hypothetical protein